MSNLVSVRDLRVSFRLGKSRVVEAVKALDPEVKVVVGGAPVTQAYADQIGADGFGDSASDATRVVERLLAR